MGKYSITIPEIRAYLATLKPDATAGIVANAESCLVARALDHKYGQEMFLVYTHEFTTLNAEDTIDPLPDEIFVIVRTFDGLGVNQEEISRRTVEEAIPQLKGE